MLLETYKSQINFHNLPHQYRFQQVTSQTELRRPDQ